MSEDYLAQQPIATWNSARGVWETSQVNLLCGHSALWQEVWPTSGIAVNGQLFELQMPEHLTADLGFSLLPTPMSRDYKGDATPHERNGEVQTDTVERAILHSQEVTQGSWGKFAPAIRRWEEVLGRPAPLPTKPDRKDGGPRLSSKFTEWMMGLPRGWITEVGLSRKSELFICGNGVVPQQATLALRVLLEGINLKSGPEEIHNP